VIRSVLLKVLMEFLQIFYFLWIKISLAMLLAINFFGIPVVTVFVMMLAWPTKTVHLAYDCYVKKKCYIRPVGVRALLLGVILFIGVIVYGTQMNWIFNMPPSSLFNFVSHNFVEGYDQHLKELEAKKPPTRTNLPTELRRYELVAYNPPKHFYVSLEDVKTHNVFRRIYVSKHCNSASSNKIGDEYN